MKLPHPKSPGTGHCQKPFTMPEWWKCIPILANTPRDLMVAMRSSPYGAYGHMLADQNTFQILYGGKRLFYNSGFKIDMKDPHRLGWYKHTRGHNGILVDNLGQPFDTEAYGYIARFINGKAMSFALGDASQAYSSAEEDQDAGLKKFRRYILLLRPDIVIVYDDLEADHRADWEWLVHSPGKIIPDTAVNTFSAGNEEVSSKTYFYASGPVRWSLADTFAIAATNWAGKTDEEGEPVHYENTQVHLSAGTIHKSEKMRFLAVFMIGPGRPPGNGTVSHNERIRGVSDRRLDHQGRNGHYRRCPDRGHKERWFRLFFFISRHSPLQRKIVYGVRTGELKIGGK